MSRIKKVHFGPAYQCSNEPSYNNDEGASFNEDESSDIFRNSVLPPLQQGLDDPWHNFGKDAFHDTHDNAINPPHNDGGLANPASEFDDNSDLPLNSQAVEPVGKHVRTNEALTLYDPSYIEIINAARAKRQIALISWPSPRPVLTYNVNLPLTNQADQPIANQAHFNRAPTLTVPLSLNNSVKENPAAMSQYDCDLSQINKANALMTNPAYNSDVSTLAGPSALSSNAGDNSNPVFQSPYNYYLNLTNQNNQPMAASLYSNQSMARRPVQLTPLSFKKAYSLASLSILTCPFTGFIAYSFAAAGEHNSKCRQEAKVWLGASYMTSAISVILGITCVVLFIYFKTLALNNR